MTRETSPAAADGVLDDGDGTPVIRFVRHYPHPVGEVWASLTQPDRLAEWWLPFEADIVLELIEGGRFQMRSHEDPSVVLDLRVLRVDAPVLFEHTHVDPGSVVRWELQPDGDGCTLHLSQTVAVRDIAIERNYLVGLHRSLDRLAATLAGTPIPWDWDQFAADQAHYRERGLAGPG